MITDNLAEYLASVSAPWMERGSEMALCAQTDPELFFPDAGEWTASRRAKKVCAACPLLTECRSWALNHPQLTPVGVWGGLTETERRRLRAEPAASDKSTQEAA